MKTILLLALTSTTSVALINGPTKVDVEKSTIKWHAAKVTGEHHGTVELKDATLTFDDGKLMGGNFVVDMTTIANKDLEGNWKDKLEGHLKSDDFFGVKDHPTASFEITEVKDMGSDKYKITGDMTIKGQTHPLSFDATVKNNTASATLEIDRTKYNVRYGSDKFFDNLGDKTIYDEFQLEISLKY
ncbi:MAG: YceI family protein [Saprospiraceae bacterium]|nr:YceI family protein [Saprospiraceae bacterium]